MKFAIIIEPTYTVIAPEVEVIDKDLVMALWDKINVGLTANSGQCYIVDLRNVQQFVYESIHPILNMQEALEADGVRIVYTNLQEMVIQKVKQERLHLSIQITASIEDAVELLKGEKMVPGLLNEM